MLSAVRRCIWARVLASLVTFLPITAAARQSALSVWFLPAGYSPDIVELFTKPEEWKEARSRIDTSMFGPGQVQSASPKRDSPLNSLLAADAFRLPAKWGLKIALGVPALKEWDCEGRQTPAIAVEEMKTVYNAGGTVQFIDMDEPLISTALAVFSFP
jgi:hypothetical protein